MKIKTLLAITFMALVFTYSAYAQQFNNNRLSIGLHFSADFTNISSIYEWRQEVCTLGCRATGHSGSAVFNFGLNLQIAITKNLLFQPGVQSFNRIYTEVGFLEGIVNNPTYDITRKSNYVSFPLTLRQILSRSEKQQFFAEGGVMIDFLIRNSLNENETVYNDSLADSAYSFTGGIGTTLISKEEYVQLDFLLRYTRSLTKYNSLESIISPDRLEPYALGLVLNFRFGLLKTEKP